MVERIFLQIQTYWSEAYTDRNDHLRSTAQSRGYHSGNRDNTNTKEPQEQFNEVDAFIDFANAAVEGNKMSSTYQLTS